MYGTLLLIHILAATIWTGGHIVLSVVVLPRVLKERSVKRLLEFESVYERIGMPAMILQVITGLALVHLRMPKVSTWFDVSNPASYPVMAKLGLLGLTLALAVNARFWVIPNLTPETLPVMGRRIVSVTVLSVLFVIVGVSFRTGWFY